MNSLVSAMGAMRLGDARVIDDFTDALASDLSDAFRDAKCIAVDAEGVDLSRAGQICIIQVSTTSQCFLFDVLNKKQDDHLVSWLRDLLENEEIVKIIHDCRMDSDALSHLLGINLVNVHDTSCWHAAEGHVDQNLNDTLSHYGLQPNIIRDGSVYQRNPKFWATRPLTRQMVEWASGDVQCIFELYQRQLQSASKLVQRAGEEGSKQFLDEARSAKIAFVTVANPGRFIGKGGVGIRQLQSSTSTIIYSYGVRSDKKFMVYYHNDAALRKVQRAASN